MFDDIIRALFSLSFNFLDIKMDVNDITETIKSFADFTTMKNTAIWTIAKSCHSIVLPIALSLLVLFTLIKFIKEALEINKFTWERVVMMMIEFFIYKVLVEKSFDICSAIMGITSDIFNKVFNIVSTSGGATALGDALADICSGGLVKQVVLFIIILFLWIGLIGTIVGIMVQVVMVFVKLIMGFSVSPIPVAFGQSDGGGSNTTKTFFMWIASLGLEYSLILICVKIYTLGLGSISLTTGVSLGVAVGSIIGILFANALLMASLSYCSQLAEKITGGR